MRRLNLTIALGLVAALVGALLVLAYGSSVQDRISEGKETLAVLVASKPIEAGATAESLAELTESQDVPREYVAVGALRDLEAVAGLVLSAPVAEGAQLTTAQFTTPDAVALLEPEAGNVAVAVQVGLSPGVARYLAPGSSVDVFATYETITGGEAAQAGGADAINRTKLFLSGVRVLSVSVAPARQDEEGSTSSSLANEVLTVLEVSPEDAEMLVNATTLGTLYLALSTEGEKHTTPSGVTPDDVVNNNKRG